MATHKSYADKRFGQKKADLERRKISLVEGCGGWFGLPHISFHTHFHSYAPYLVPDYPFLAVERDIDTFRLMCQSRIALEANNMGEYGGEFTDGIYYDIRKSPITGRRIVYDPCLMTCCGDVFETLFKSYPVVKYIQDGTGRIRIPKYNYGHLDFCCTAATLTGQHIEYNLRRLAQWWNLKSPFHLDITVALHGDKNKKSAILLLEHAIPTIFEQVNWKLEHYFTTTYADTSENMATGFYVFHKD